ncbi:MAG: PilZ domain-containing protein [Chloroflexota bacterium]
MADYTVKRMSQADVPNTTEKPPMAPPMTTELQRTIWRLGLDAWLRQRAEERSTQQRDAGNVSPDDADGDEAPEPAPERPEAATASTPDSEPTGSTPHAAPGSRDDPSRRAMYRTSVDLPATLDFDVAQPIPVRITNISGSGAALLLPSADPLPAGTVWLDLAIPNRPKPLELEVRQIRRRHIPGENGQPDQQMIHVHFPGIRLGEQDAIIAYINNIRLYEGKQYTVAATVKMEVVTGRRRFAKFTGETMEIRPDKMKLMMDDFDAIENSEVMVTVMAPHFADHMDVDDVTVEKVKVVGPRKAEVDVVLSKPSDELVLFIRKHYPGAAKGRR